MYDAVDAEYAYDKAGRTFESIREAKTSADYLPTSVGELTFVASTYVKECWVVVSSSYEVSTGCHTPAAIDYDPTV